MRGWVLVALARAEMSDEALPFVLEELDTGVDPYLVAAAAWALRSYPNPGSALAPFVMRAINQIRYHDDPVSFQAYGDYAISSSATSPVRELLVTLAWLGPHARGVLPGLEAIVRIQVGGPEGEGGGRPDAWKIDPRRRCANLSSRRWRRLLRAYRGLAGQVLVGA